MVVCVCAGDRGVYPLRGGFVQRHGQTPQLYRGAGSGEQSMDGGLGPVERSAGCWEQSPHGGGGQHNTHTHWDKFFLFFLFCSSRLLFVPSGEFLLVSRHWFFIQFLRRGSVSPASGCSLSHHPPPHQGVQIRVGQCPQRLGVNMMIPY